MAEKPHLNLVVIGHVDHGKSTTVGRLLFETGAIEKHKIDKFREEAEKIGKATFEFAWVMDNLKEERERGLTIDVAHKRFDTEKFYFTIIDAPGHRDFVKNMITGASQADAAVLVVAVGERDEKGRLMPQTMEHVYLAWTLGISQMIVAINKMDSIKYDKAKFEETKKLLEELFNRLGWKKENLTFIPTSGLKGDNIKEKGKLDWWDGPTLLDSLNKLETPEKPIKLPLRVPVQDVYTITGIGTVPVGRVETGILKVGEKITFEPAGVNGEVKSIEMHHQEMPKAEPGDNIGFNVRGIGKDDIRRGDVGGPASKPPTVAKEFTAQIMVLNHPSAITVGYTPVFHAHTAQVACKFVELISKLDPRTGNVTEKNPTFLKSGEAGAVRIQPTRPLVVEPFKENPYLGRFAIRDMGSTVAAGKVVNVTPAK
jgi:elongation factor 1-alpha